MRWRWTTGAWRRMLRKEEGCPQKEKRKEENKNEVKKDNWSLEKDV